jgi:hypothetical protein
MLDLKEETTKERGDVGPNLMVARPSDIEEDSGGEEEDPNRETPRPKCTPIGPNPQVFDPEVKKRRISRKDRMEQMWKKSQEPRRPRRKPNKKPEPKRCINGARCMRS